MSQPSSFSIVPSLLTPPIPPSRMRMQLVLSGYGVALGLGIFVLLGAPFVLALPGIDAEALLRVTLAQGVVVAVVLAAVTTYSVKRMEPIYQTLLLGPRDAPLGPGPALRAVAAAFRYPERATWITIACAQLVPLIDAFGLLPVSGLSGWARVAVDLLMMAVAAAGSMPSIVLYRHIIWRWLGRLNPRDVPLPTQERLADRLALTVAVPVGIVGTAAVVVLSSHLVALRTRVLPPIQMGAISIELDLTAAALALGLIVATTALAWSLAQQLGDELAHDVSSIRRQIERVQLGEAPQQGPVQTMFRSLTNTPAGQELAAALSDLSQRFAQMREKEREGRLAMEQAQRLRTQFLASMSHDLRSPLNSLLGFATLIASGVEGPITHEQRESIQMITRSARDLLRLVTNILDSARLEAGRLTLARSWTPAADIMTQAIADGRRMLEDRHLEIEAEIAPNLPPLYADQDRVVQAVLGLFSHAIHATERGTIRVLAHVHRGAPGPAKPHLRIDVIDQGAGIREADQATLFEAFREIQEPSGRRIGGLGLGLALARELIRAHGGDIWFVSKRGRGTTFMVVLPLTGPSQRFG
ncbi:MAG: integral rane sensor signal transduction histidine kinase [Myxococcaceae bacterium]|nr:integral rane sensor signal transduction histidine kinase [Myxococcaceae bacterium]